jgi:hypothetical protein
VPELRQAAYGERLEDIESLIGRHFASVLADDEKTLLASCRQLRNKILHCDFRAARRKLEGLGTNPRSGNVKRVDISGMTRAEMAEKIGAAAADNPGSAEPVGDIAMGAGIVFGWLLEAGAAGDFRKAAEVFARGASVLDRLAMAS